MKRQLTILAIIVAIVIGIIVALVIASKPGAKTPNWKTLTNQTAAKIPDKPNVPIIQAGTVPALVVSSPQPAGDAVMIAKVAIPIHGFVVVSDAATNQIVGASSVILSPETMDIKIAATVVKGHSYLAEIHADGDKNSIFNSKLDPPFIVNGKTVSAAFKVK
jgi:hypothetical protein